MKRSTIIILVVAAIAAVIVIIGLYSFLNSALTPLEQKENNALIDTAQYVDIEATTFNGDIVIQPSTGTKIEITYNIQAPQGNLNDITATSTNQTENGVTKVTAEAKVNPGIPK